METPRSQAAAGDSSESEGRQGIDAAARAGKCAFELSDNSGAVLNAAPSVLWRDGAILYSADTDDRGLLEWDADSQAAELYVASAGRPVHRREVVLEPGTHVIELPGGEVVAGQVRMEQGELPEELMMVLRSDHPLNPEGRIPEEVLESLGVYGYLGSIPLRSFTAADGTFRFSGLPMGWTGELSSSGLFRLTATTTGQIDANGGRLRLDGPAEDLELTLRRKTSLRGRLVGSDNGLPLVGVILQLRAKQRAERPDTFATQLKRSESTEDGAFSFILPFDSLGELESIEISLSGDLARGPIFQVQRDGIPADGHLGDIKVDGLRDVPFRLLERDGDPIAGGTARADPSWWSNPSDADGFGVLRNLPLARTQMRIQAAGYLPAEAPIPDSVQEPIEVRLLPANRLEVVLKPPAGEDPPACRISLSHPERLLEPEGENRDDLYFHVPGAQLWDSEESPGGEVIRATCTPDAAGLAIFQALRPGVEFELEVSSTSGDPIFHQQAVAPLGPQETRRLVVELGFGMRPFRGRVLDAAGLPLVRASLRLGNEILGFTDRSGSFQFITMTAGPKTLLVKHETCATLFLEDYLVPSDGLPVEFRLDPPLTVTIEVVDEDGAAVLGAEVSTRIHGFTATALDLGGGRFQATQLSAEPIEIRTRVMGQSLTQTHYPAIPVARVWVPSKAGGRVKIELTGSRKWSAASYMLIIHPLPPNPAEPQRLFPIRPEKGSFEFPSVPPGKYLALLLGLSPPEEPGGSQDVAEAEFTVHPGQETSVKLDVNPN